LELEAALLGACCALHFISRLQSGERKLAGYLARF
jgi:hypothetical protein